LITAILTSVQKKSKNENKSVIKKSLIKIEKVLEKSPFAPRAGKTIAPIAVKLKLTELILHLMKRKSPFGLFAILGWQRKWQEHLDISDSYQDIFDKHRINIMNIKASKRARRDVASTVSFDGAILINNKGDILHSGVMIEGLWPRKVAAKVNPGQFRDLSEQFGFKKKVHTRHLSAIAASYIFKNTTVFTVSEETGNFHIFENGQIVFSTASGEIHNVK